MIIMVRIMKCDISMSKYQNNLVSIIMPMYNAEKYIASSIESVLSQTYALWELIVIDDCSSDKSLNIVKVYAKKHKKIKLLCLKKNQGVAQARNEGIKMACGRYIAFLDSDDVWLPKKLEHQIEFMYKKQAAISYTQYRQFTNNIDSCGKLIDVNEKINYQNLLKGNIIGCLTVMIDRNFVTEIHMPSERHEDYITWLNILKKNVYAYGLKQDLARYRKSLNSLSGNKFKSLLWTWNIYRRVENISLLKSIWYFSHYIINGIKKHF